ncbi:AGAP012173-PA-like protein [Anopheles sinensis]|uniref:AGAP012173-PA-like protein n=1 Tax=Anopheles sinensis TaxID=74873 RepID=A0A084W8C6_ANOSI|nr:AGAP012173-PA-like protein [Anopheles sinensis]
MTQLDVSTRMIRCVLNAIGPVKLADTSALKYFLGKATNLQAIDGEGMTLLHCLIVLKQYGLAKYLIEEYGFDIGAINTQNGWNAFHYCANIPFPETNQNRMARMDLLEHMMVKDHSDRHLSVRDSQGKNVLHHAVMNRHFWIAKCILQRKMKVGNAEDQSSAVTRHLTRAGLIDTQQCSDFILKDLNEDEAFWKATLVQTRDTEQHSIGNVLGKAFVKV